MRRAPEYDEWHEDNFLLTSENFSHERVPSRMPSHRILALFATASLLAASAPAWSQPYGTKPGNHMGSNGLSAQDTRMARMAAESGIAEVKLGELAVRKALRPEVRQFGEHMIKDHHRANKDLKQWAQGVRVQLPTAMNAQHQALYNKLSRLGGARFDREYMQAMDHDHKIAFDLFNRGSQEAHNGSLKNFFAKYVPTIQQHLQRAEEIRKAL